MSQRNGRPHAAETAVIAGGGRLQVADGDSGLAVCRAEENSIEVRVAWSSEHALRFRLGKRISRDTGRLRAAAELGCGVSCMQACMHDLAIRSFVRCMYYATNGRTVRNINRGKYGR